MSDNDTPDEPPAAEIWDNLMADLRATGWVYHLQTVLLTLGILAFGFMLGVHFYAAHVFSTLPPLALVPQYEPLQTLYTDTMKTGVLVAGGCLVTGIALTMRGNDEQA